MAVLTELSLFSGAGGGLLATKHLLGWRTVCYVEWDRYAVEVLKARIRDGYLDDAPIWDDAFTFDGQPWAGLVDVVSAGFPCQPFSAAGKGLAERDPRNGWPAVIRILREVRPRYAFLENVPGLISKPYFRRILGDLAEAGFDIRHDCLSAQEVGAPHLRERLWIVAHAEGSDGSLPAGREWQGKANPNGNGASRDVADATIQGLEKSADIQHAEHSRNRRIEYNEEGGKGTRDIRGGQWWSVEPDMGRVANGVASRVDRLAAIGNGQVPAVARAAWNGLTKGLQS
jgi:DNA (cytosine-5)-methyltransferase 1